MPQSLSGTQQTQSELIAYPVDPYTGDSSGTSGTASGSGNNDCSDFGATFVLSAAAPYFASDGNWHFFIGATPGGDLSNIDSLDLPGSSPNFGGGQSMISALAPGQSATFTACLTQSRDNGLGVTITCQTCQSITVTAPAAPTGGASGATSSGNGGASGLSAASNSVSGPSSGSSGVSGSPSSGSGTPSGASGTSGIPSGSPPNSGTGSGTSGPSSGAPSGNGSGTGSDTGDIVYFWCVDGQLQQGLNPPPDTLYYVNPSQTGCAGSGLGSGIVPSGTQSGLGSGSSGCAFTASTPAFFAVGHFDVQGRGVEAWVPVQDGWILVVEHTQGGQTSGPIEVTPDGPRPPFSDPVWFWADFAHYGVNVYRLTWTKPGCPTQIQTFTITVAGGLSGSGTGSGSGTPTSGTSSGATSGNGTTSGSPCPPCPPPPDAFVCAPTVAFVKPEASAPLQGIARVRVSVTDPNEQTDPCHHNYNRPCNHEADGPGLELYLGGARLPVTWKHTTGTPLNGTWETFFDTRDYSNGAHTLRATALGVGCCSVESTRPVTLTNTMQANIFYRDTRREVASGLVIPDALIGIETRDLDENTARLYWMETAVRTGTALDATPDTPYKHDDWRKHQPVLLSAGEHWNASGKRFERTNYSAHVTFRLPLSSTVRVRRKWTPQFYLSAFDLNAETVAKIRQISEGRHYVFTTNPARVWIYDGEKLNLTGDFATPPALDAGELGSGEHESDFDLLDRAADNIYAPNAIDATVLSDTATGDKIYVVVPPASPAERGEVFAFDPDSGQLALGYGIRRENRLPRFIETLGKRVICLYVHDQSVPLPANSKRTRAYDLTFSTPKLLWQLAAPATLTAIDDNTLFIACNQKLYATTGDAAPTLLHDFPAPITAATTTFVGLQNGTLWKKTTAGYILVNTLPFPLGAITSWSAGTAIKDIPGAGETQTEPPRGVCAGEGVWLYGERKDGTWRNERDLRVPNDLALQSKTVTRITALDHFSIKVDPPAVPPPTTLHPPTIDATTPPQRDERLLIGTTPNALLFIYQRSLLSENEGAIPVSRDTIPRLFPFPRQKTD